MQDVKFEETYSLIALNWAIGYLADEELVPFLKKCKAALGANDRPTGCLIVLDNEYDAEICPFEEEHGQRFRYQKASEALFKEAGLEIKNRRGPEELVKDFMKVTVWTLA